MMFRKKYSSSYTKHHGHQRSLKNGLRYHWDESMEQRVSSGIIVYRETTEGPRFLTLYYGHNYWTFPRGKIDVEKEEKSFEAALRETREETGLTRNDFILADSFKTREDWVFTQNNKKIHRTVIFYLAKTDKRYIRLSDEHQGYCWLLYREALKIFCGERHSENRKVIRQAYEYITGQRAIADKRPWRSKKGVHEKNEIAQKNNVHRQNDVVVPKQPPAQFHTL